LQTYDAGVTVEHWSRVVPLPASASTRQHVVEDCAHWWAWARHCLRALETLHEHRVVHLDLKADNVCIPWLAADAGGEPGSGVVLQFDRLRLIDFAFCLTADEPLSQPLPLARHGDYDYQSPRLVDALDASRRGNLGPTRQLDWRCDLFSLAAMLWLYLPEADATPASGWSPELRAQAGTLVRRLLDEHGAERPTQRPHRQLVALTSHPLSDPDIAASLRRGWHFQARAEAETAWATPLTLVAGLPGGLGAVVAPGSRDGNDPGAAPSLASARRRSTGRRWHRSRRPPSAPAAAHRRAAVS
jgi:serine/threonine protein kinase